MSSKQSRVLLGLNTNTPLIFWFVLYKNVITVSLCRISRIWLIKQVLYSNKDLLYSDSRSPATILIKN